MGTQIQFKKNPKKKNKSKKKGNKNRKTTKILQAEQAAGIRRDM
jgi:hypothetical protein